MDENEVRVNVTFAGQNGDLPDPIPADSAEGDIRQWVTEAVRAGDVPGIPADPNANFSDHVIERYAATEVRPYSLIQLRPKTSFGFLPKTVFGHVKR